ncbi:MAG: aspartate kinase [Candidatus Thermoplasmatota archaeon]|nr:aspartate kinase [Candidatus Thermoplasmatota archaeon]
MAKEGKGPKDVEEAVQIYLRENPEIFLALEQNLLNISKLSKDIAEENRQLNPISVRGALIRIKERKKGDRTKNKADDLLKKSKISLQDKISVVSAKKLLHLKYISATFLEGSVVYIVDEMEQKLPQENDEISVDSHVSMIHIYSPSEIESTPGFIMRITHKLYARGINILQLISCSNETILILKKDSCISAYEILSAA